MQSQLYFPAIQFAVKGVLCHNLIQTHNMLYFAERDKEYLAWDLSQVRQTTSCEAMIVAPQPELVLTTATDVSSSSSSTSSWRSSSSRNNHSNGHSSSSSTNNHSSSSNNACPGTSSPPSSLSFGQELFLQPRADLGPLTYGLSGGATAADCVLCAVDAAAGLMRALGLSPVMVVVGVTRGPALSAGEVVTGVT